MIIFVFFQIYLQIQNTWLSTCVRNCRYRNKNLFYWVALTQSVFGSISSVCYTWADTVAANFAQIRKTSVDMSPCNTQEMQDVVIQMVFFCYLTTMICNVHGFFSFTLSVWRELHVFSLFIFILGIQHVLYLLKV